MKTNRPLIFLGTRSAMKSLVWLAERNGYEVLGILDRQYYNDKNTQKDLGLPILGSEEDILHPDFYSKLGLDPDLTEFFVAPIFVGMNFSCWQKRVGMIDLVSAANVRCANIIDPHVRIAPDVKLGQNILIQFGCFIDCDTVIGDFTTLGPGAGLGDHVTVGSNCTIGPHCLLGTGVVIENNVCTGAHSCIGRVGNHIATIGTNSIIAIQAVVYRDIAENSIVLPNGKVITNTKTNTDRLEEAIMANLARISKTSA